MGVGRSRRLLFVALLFLGAALAGVAFWLARRDSHRLPGQPSVIVITIDTLRADAVGPGKPTPVLNRFLETATRFTRARTVAPLTVPAHLSLFSGLEPHSHGIPDNSTAGVPPDRGYPLLAEEFRAAGYETAAFISCSVLGRHTGLAAGFDTFVPPATTRYFSEISARLRVAAPLDWLAAHRDGPVFVWVHFFDPHWPYGEDAPAGAGIAEHATRNRQLYAREVARVDSVLSALLAAAPEDAVVVIASDHGEGLLEHGEPTHGYQCWATTIDAFLAVRCPALPPGTEDARVCSLADVAPTLRAWCGLPTVPGDGIPLFRDGARVVISESLVAWREHRWGQVFAATDGRYTLIESGPRVQVFDRAVDPRERNPLPNPVRHAAYVRLDRALTAYRQAGGTRHLRPIDASVGSPYGHARVPETVYLSRRENAALRDPGTRFAELRRIDRSLGLAARAVATRDLELLKEVIARFSRASRADPDNPAYHHRLFHAYAAAATLAPEPQAPELARDAVAAGVRAVECGYALASVLEDLCRQSLAAGDLRSQQRVFDLALGGVVRPDGTTVASVAKLAAALQRAGVRGIEERMRRYRAQAATR